MLRAGSAVLMYVTPRPSGAERKPTACPGRLSVAVGGPPASGSTLQTTFIKPSSPFSLFPIRTLRASGEKPRVPVASGTESTTRPSGASTLSFLGDS